MIKYIYKGLQLLRKSIQQKAMHLVGKNVCYVGGFGGIGVAAIKEFLKKSLANLYILDLFENKDLLQNFQNEFPGTHIFFCKFNITDKGCIKECLKKVVTTIGHIDVFVNGAGILGEDRVEETIAINLTGLINTTRAVRDIMDKSKNGRGGVILNIASLAGLVAFPGLEIYCATKHGVLAFTKAISDQATYDRTGVAMVLLCPGCTDTPILKDVVNLERFQMQPVDIVGEFLVKCVEIEKNGGIYFISGGKSQEIEHNPYHLN